MWEGVLWRPQRLQQTAENPELWRQEVSVEGTMQPGGASETGGSEVQWIPLAPLSGQGDMKSFKEAKRRASFIARLFCKCDFTESHSISLGSDGRQHHFFDGGCGMWDGDGGWGWGDVVGVGMGVRGREVEVGDGGWGGGGDGGGGWGWGMGTEEGELQ